MGVDSICQGSYKAISSTSSRRKFSQATELSPASFIGNISTFFIFSNIFVIVIIVSLKIYILGKVRKKKVLPSISDIARCILIHKLKFGDAACLIITQGNKKNIPLILFACFHLHLCVCVCGWVRANVTPI